jgi:phosphoglycolate phosphatase-like HAD superfamily hydrolase
MYLQPKHIVALDFDGVICDGLKEYFQSALRSYQNIWQDLPDEHIPNLAERFYLLRPVVETGWEMPVLLRAIVLYENDIEIFQNWSNLSLEILRSTELDKNAIGKHLDIVRDNWIATNLDEWLELHQLYPEIKDKLQAILSSSIEFYIITTKTARFVTELLQKYRIIIPESRVIGKEAKQPKHESLRRIIAEYNDRDLRVDFVEDRLNTLLSVKEQPDLESVNLYLADWGYNTVAERELAAKDDRIQLISLSQLPLSYTNSSNSDDK